MLQYKHAFPEKPVPLMLRSMANESVAVNMSNVSERMAVSGSAHPILAAGSTWHADLNGAPLDTLCL